jgi:L-fuconolactonase
MIFVESGCEPVQSLAEVDWISGLAGSEPRLKAIVAHAPLEKGGDARADLEALASRPLVKGVRRSLQGESDLAFCMQRDFIAGVRLLAEFGFTFDVCVRHEQLAAIAGLVRSVPDVTFVLDHFGKPDVRGTRKEPWATELKALATLPNVVCKISGLTTEADWKNWQPADLAFYFERALECFGFDRILFGSDWPVVTLAADYDRWLDVVRGAISFASEADRTKLFQTNAERIYRV